MRLVIGNDQIYDVNFDGFGGMVYFLVIGLQEMLDFCG